MPSRRGKAADTVSQTQPPADAEHVVSFPFARYTSIVGVHTSLLAFSALLLPGTSSSFLTQWNTSSGSQKNANRDIEQLLTENLLRTIAWMCVGAFILQSWWASWTRQWALESRTRNTDSAETTQKKFERKEWKKQRVLVYGQAVAMTLAGSLAFFAITILFGAPLSSHLSHTYLMSLLLAVLTILPPAYTLGPPSFGTDSPSLVSRFTWVRLFAELSPRTPIERALVYPAVGAVLGCWVGVIPIGLDWERPWQAWPLTPTFGAVGGSILGSLIALVVSATLELAQADRQSQQPPARIAAGKSKRS